MGLRDDGDIIKGLGFVALYAAYLEEAIDGCVERLSVIDGPIDKRIMRWPASRKLDYCVNQLKKLGSGNEELENFSLSLKESGEMLEHRNDVLHGRIYAQYGHPDIRKSGRQGVPDREIDSSELYHLANDIYEICSPLMHAVKFAIPRALAARRVCDNLP